MVQKLGCLFNFINKIEWDVLKHFPLVNEQFELLFSVIWVRMTARSKLAILASM
jgi:hypothetical protein